MSQVEVEKCKCSEGNAQSLLERMESLAESIRERAFSLFEHRNGNGGSDLDDWLQAEQQLIWKPATELVDKEKEIVARIALPGFSEKDVRVSATADALIVEAESKHSHSGKDDGVQFCEFSDKHVYRRLDLPAAVDVDKVKASLDKGILEVVAPKAAARESGARLAAVA